MLILIKNINISLILCALICKRSSMIIDQFLKGIESVTENLNFTFFYAFERVGIVHF